MTTHTHRDLNASEGGLFDDLPEPDPVQMAQAQKRAADQRRHGAPRRREPDRSQVELRASDLESLLAEDHRARLVWGYVVRQDLSRLFDAVKARGSHAGRAAIDPRVLFALWLYATLEGVGSGREVARLSQEHDTYQWICGGVSVNCHAFNDFRSGNELLMDELLTNNVAALAAAGAISLERVAQNGMCAPTPVPRHVAGRPVCGSIWTRPANWCARSRNKPGTTRAKALEELLPWLYPKGISTGDFQEALTVLLGKEAPGLSASPISRLKKSWKDDQQRWSRCDLSNRR